MLAFYLSLLPVDEHQRFQTFYPRYEGKLYAVALSVLKNHHRS